ncbi:MULTISPECIES: phosphatidylcholine synthase [unclassified Bradyrhizobium]|uniref:phosphatidylcholine synthase n=1 Tax=unclassified Bradyrhizobium TaxID=2631580 RepID=UPI0024E0EB7D|nr:MULTISPECIES: CDP-alcohol phosphatidyltransferase family protein [unclassified Bradyrhizobium]
MDQLRPESAVSATPVRRAAAMSVHVFTALGAGVALIAMLQAVREHWTAMFWWLGVALVIDGIDGPLARWLDVVHVQPDWSGDVLDLVVDFTTYVFVPAYAITASGLLLPLAAPVIGVGIAVTGALYFADRRMKSDDNHFRGFPGLWNIAAFYLFLLQPPPLLATLGLAILTALTFVPFHVIHPVRVERLRWLTLLLVALGVVLVIYALSQNFSVSPIVTALLCAIGLYIVASDSAIRLLRSLKA